MALTMVVGAQAVDWPSQPSPISCRRSIQLWRIAQVGFSPQEILCFSRGRPYYPSRESHAYRLNFFVWEVRASKRRIAHVVGFI